MDIRRPRHFHMVYTTETNQLLATWKKNLEHYDDMFMEKNKNNPRQDYVKSQLLSSPQRQAILRVGETILATAIPIGVNYE